MRVFVFYIVVFETNSSVPLPKALLPYPPPFDQSGNRAGPVRPDRPAGSPGLDQKPTRARLLRSLATALASSNTSAVGQSFGSFSQRGARSKGDQQPDGRVAHNQKLQNILGVDLGILANQALRARKTRK
jgi:hypothetical protein